MKKIILAVAAALAMTSCSLFTKSTTVSGDTAVAGNTPVVTTPQAPKPTTPKTPKTPAKPSTPATPKAPAHDAELAAQLQGEWTIVGYGKKEIHTDDEMPYIIFDNADSRFYASNGCNIVNGFFTATDRGITFANVLTTMRMCPDVTYQYDISEVLKDGVTVKTHFEKKGNETLLILSNASGHKLLTLRRHNMEALNGQWNLIRLNGQTVTVDDMNIFFDIPELRIHGNTGCNYFNGDISIDSHQPNSISFSSMAVTGRLCPNSDLEMAMLVALEQVTTYRLTTQGTHTSASGTSSHGSGTSATLLLLDSASTPLLVLHRP